MSPPQAQATVIRRHLDVGLAGLILTIIIQTVTIVWWASGVDRRVTQLEKEIVPVSAVAVSVARLEERTEGIGDTMRRIERRLEAEERQR